MIAKLPNGVKAQPLVEVLAGRVPSRLPLIGDRHAAMSIRQRTLPAGIPLRASGRKLRKK